MSAPQPAAPAARPTGLQAERTRLAWSRTALVLLGNAGLVALKAPHSRVPVLTWATVAAAGLAGLFVLVVARFRAHELAAHRAVAAPVRLTLIGVLVAALCVVVGLDVVVAWARPA